MASRTRLRTALVVPLLAALTAGPTAVSPSAAATGDWRAAPASSDEEGRPHFYLEGAPGAVLEDTVSVTNPGPEPLRVTLRGADAYNRRDGSFAVRAPADSRDAGAWVAFAEDAAEQVTVPPRTRADIPFAVTVPATAAPGDHPGAVVVAAGGREAGIRLHLRVTGPTLAALGIEDVEVAGEELRYVLVNRGTVAVTPSLAVRAEGFYGDVLRHGPRSLDVELLPGRRAALAEPWPGTSSLDSVDIALTATAPGAAPARATASYTAFPWTGALVVVLAAAAAGATAWHLRRRRGAAASGGADSGGADEPPAGEPESHEMAGATR